MDRCRGCRRAVKELLLDQSVVAGIGNIYADEILYRTGIHPCRPANTLTGDECASLSLAIPEVLLGSIEANGMTPQQFIEGRGLGYRTSEHILIYGRSGDLCGRCGSVIQRTVVGGRGSCFCPSCQR